MSTETKLLELALRNGLVISSRQALQVVGRHAWERMQAQGTWIQIAPGWFRHAATVPTFAMTARAGSAWLGHRGALFASSALHWLGFDIDPPLRPEFLVQRQRRSIRELTLHTTTRWDDKDIIRHAGVRTTTATRAIIDFATTSPTAGELERLIDEGIRKRRTALPRLSERLRDLSGTGRTGCALVRELLLDSGGESHLERRFLSLLRGAGFPRPQCQVAFRSNGTTVARVDFLFRGTNVVVEVSGRLGHVSDRERQKDARRRNHLQQEGMVVLEFTTTDVIDTPRYVLDTLTRALPVTQRRRAPDVRV